MDIKLLSQSEFLCLMGHLRRLTTGWTAWVRSRVSEVQRFFFTLCVQTGPEVHSASYKMSNMGFPRGKGGRLQDQPPYLFLGPWLCTCEPLHPHSPVGLHDLQRGHLLRLLPIDQQTSRVIPSRSLHSQLRAETERQDLQKILKQCHKKMKKKTFTFERHQE